MRIGIYGTGVVAQLVWDIAKEYDVSVVFFIQTIPERNIFRSIPVVAPYEIDFGSIDYLVLGSDVYRQEMSEELKKCVLNYDRNQSKIIDYDNFVDLVKGDIDYKIVRVDKGISYIYTKYDTVIGPYMNKTHRNWAGDMIDELVDFAFDNTDFKASGFFFDIGANIGTTSIYVKKCWPELNVIAFEPGKKNYDLFRANCILNGVEDCHIVNMGLGSQPSDGFLFYRSYNPGGSMVVSKKSEIATEHVTIGVLDDYMTKNTIDPREVSFIWMDTEGFEADIIVGAKELLSKRKVPLVHEFDPQIYKDRGVSEEYLNIMKSTYTHFFDVNDKENGQFKIKSVDELEKMMNGNKTDLFFF